MIPIPGCFFIWKFRGLVHENPHEAPGISRRFRPTGIGSWRRRGNSGRTAASGPRDG